MLSVDLEGLEDEVKPKMKATSKKLKSAASLLSGLIIPEDFKYRDKIKNMPDKIFNVEEEVSDTRKWLDTCITGFYNAEESNKSIVDKIKNFTTTNAENFIDDVKTLINKVSSEIVSNFESLLWNLFNFNQNVLDKASELANFTFNAIDKTGAKIVDVQKSLLGNLLGIEEPEEKNEYVDSNKVDDLFQELSKGTGLYGIDQGVFKRIIKDYSYYKIIRDEFETRYNMNSIDTEIFMATIDSLGACTYADVANQIVGFYKDNPEDFEEKFGFPLYRKLPDGSEVLNDVALLADLYMYVNHVDNGGKLIYKNSYGMNVMNRDQLDIITPKRVQLKQGDSQKYLTLADGMNTEEINKYLQSKDNNLEYESGVIKGIDVNFPKGTEKVCMALIKQKVKDDLEKGNQVDLGVRSTGNSIRYIDMDTNEVISTTQDWDGTAHTTCITGVNDKGFIVSTWGKRCLVPFEDLENGGAFRIFSSKLLKKNDKK